MKTKLEMAHEYLLRFSGATVADAWEYADAMQAEADKRERKERTDVLLTKDKDGNCLHFHHEFGHKKCMDCGASLEEWQPDWSQAPEWANWWVVTSKCIPIWVDSEPEISDNGFYWCLPRGNIKAPSFGYTGDWRNSLRKRPK